MDARKQLLPVVITIMLIFGLSSCGIFDTAARLAQPATEADKLLFSAISGITNLEAVKEAVEQGADVNVLRCGLGSPNVLMDYSKENMGEDGYRNKTGVEVAEYLLQHGADPNCTVGLSGGTSLLMYCCGALPFGGGGIETLFDLLLDAGADVNATNHAGRSALYYAVRSNQVHQVERLISLGSRCSQKTFEEAFVTYHDSPGRICAKCQVVKLILEEYAEEHKSLVQSDPGKALCLAAVQGDADAVAANLHRYTYQFDEEIPYTASLLICAFCDVNTIRELEQSGCALTEHHYYAAAYFGNVGSATYLQKKFVPALNALSVAVQYGQLELSQHLIEQLGDAGSNDHTVWDELLATAARGGNAEVVKLIYEFGAPYSPDAIYFCLMEAILFDRLSVSEYLIDEIGYDTNYFPMGYHSLLELSVLHGNHASFQFFVDRSDLDKLDCTRYLHSAVLKENHDALKELLALGLDPNVDGGANPLWEAIRVGDLAAVELLIEYGADVNFKLEYHVAGTETVKYTYPIHEAAKELSNRILIRLLDAGALPDLADSDGKIPEDVAVNSYNQAVFRN